MIHSLLILLILFPILSWADTTSRGEISFDYRGFNNDGIYYTEDDNFALMTRFEQSYSSGNWETRLGVLGRVDRKQQDRSVFIVEDAYLSYYAGDLKLTAGYKKYNWTATEAFHPADVINSRNYDSNWENLEKKGELVVEAQYPFFDGTITAMFYPRFEAPILPNVTSRLGAGVPLREAQVVEGAAEFTDELWHNQYGLELTQTFGSADWAIHYLNHIDRYTPKFGFLSLSDLSANSTNPIPFYFWVTQVGLTYQQAIAGFVLKMEYGHKTFRDKDNVLTGLNEYTRPVDHSDLALGAEYLFELPSGHEIMVLVEGQATLGTTKEERVQLNFFQRDLFVGLRYAFNDVDNKEFFISLIKDMELDDERLFNVQYSQRLTDEWKIKTGIRYIDAKKKGATAKGLEVLDDDGHVHLSLTRYF